jgi:hypothetical protein
MANIVMQFYNDGPYQACLEYSYIPTGQRLNLVLRAGTHAVIRHDVVGSSDPLSLVQVYTVQTEHLGGPACPAILATAPR